MEGIESSTWAFLLDFSGAGTRKKKNLPPAVISFPTAFLIIRNQNESFYVFYQFFPC